MTTGLPDRFTRWEAAPGWNLDLAAGLQDAQRNGETVKDEPETLLLRAPAADGQGYEWWKLTRVLPGKRLLAGLTRSRGLREWRALRAMEAAELPVATPLAFGEQRHGGGLHASLVVTREVEAARNLFHVLFGTPAPEPEREQLLRLAGEQVRRMHEAGFGHFRLQPRNLLVSLQGMDRRMHVIDTPYACAFPGPVPLPARQIDLVDLAGTASGLSTEDARIVLAAYAGDAAPPLELEALRSRGRMAQKLRRVGRYLFYTHTGHRPAPSA